MLISKLSEPIKTLAEFRRYNEKGTTFDKTGDSLLLAFNWIITPEGFDFWDNISQGRFEIYDKLYPIEDKNNTINNNYLIF